MWEKAQEWEADWWGNCANTYGEETKQLLYASRMGLQFFHNRKSPFNIDMKGASVLDVGGGPTSLLLKCVNVQGRVADPVAMPRWVCLRYAAAGIALDQVRGEELVERGWDEAWIYNVLQHTEDPGRVVANMKRAAKLVRIFEWVDTPRNEGHPHALSRELLDGWLGGEGRQEQLSGQNTCVGTAYYGIFPTGG